MNQKTDDSTLNWSKEVLPMAQRLCRHISSVLSQEEKEFDEQKQQEKDGSVNNDSVNNGSSNTVLSLKDYSDVACLMELLSALHVAPPLCVPPAEKGAESNSVNEMDWKECKLSTNKRPIPLMVAARLPKFSSRHRFEYDGDAYEILRALITMEYFRPMFLPRHLCDVYAGYLMKMMCNSLPISSHDERRNFFPITILEGVDMHSHVRTLQELLGRYRGSCIGRCAASTLAYVAVSYWDGLPAVLDVFLPVDPDSSGAASSRLVQALCFQNRDSNDDRKNRDEDLVRICDRLCALVLLPNSCPTSARAGLLVHSLLYTLRNEKCFTEHLLLPLLRPLYEGKSCQHLLHVFSSDCCHPVALRRMLNCGRKCMTTDILTSFLTLINFQSKNNGNNEIKILQDDSNQQIYEEENAALVLIERILSNLPNQFAVWYICHNITQYRADPENELEGTLNKLLSAIPRVLLPLVLLKVLEDYRNLSYPLQLSLSLLLSEKHMTKVLTECSGVQILQVVHGILRYYKLQENGEEEKENDGAELCLSLLVTAMECGNNKRSDEEEAVLRDMMPLVAEYASERQTGEVAGHALALLQSRMSAADETLSANGDDLLLNQIQKDLSSLMPPIRARAVVRMQRLAHGSTLCKQDAQVLYEMIVSAVSDEDSYVFLAALQACAVLIVRHRDLLTLTLDHITGTTGSSICKPSTVIKLCEVVQVIVSRSALQKSSYDEIMRALLRGCRVDEASLKSTNVNGNDDIIWEATTRYFEKGNSNDNDCDASVLEEQQLRVKTGGPLFECEELAQVHASCMLCIAAIYQPHVIGDAHCDIDCVYVLERFLNIVITLCVNALLLNKTRPILRAGATLCVSIYASAESSDVLMTALALLAKEEKKMYHCVRNLYNDAATKNHVAAVADQALYVRLKEAMDKRSDIESRLAFKRCIVADDKKSCGDVVRLVRRMIDE